jgi:translation initiation factor 5B
MAILMIRQPIITVMGHVDHGKTTLLDRIRNTRMAGKEAGGITQHIGASEVPAEVIKDICSSMLKRMNANIVIPGLLFIDTPGHEAFTNLRKRGGAVSDLAIVVVDITKNFEPQTYETIEILKGYKVPFIIAANKVDLITGWRNTGKPSFLEALAEQQQGVVEALEAKIYELVGSLSEVGFSSERFDRVRDAAREISIIPISAKTGEGMAELLMYTAGLAQRFLGKNLEIDVNEPGKGSIIEKKEERGLGTTLDVILYDGTLKVNDTVAFATASGVKQGRIRAMLRPKPLNEMRDASSKFYYIEMASAACGVKISGAGFEDALSGSEIVSTRSADFQSELAKELAEIFDVDKAGVILKADTIGSLEALSRLLKAINVNIGKKDIGNVTKRDVLDAFAMRGTDPTGAVVLAFNVSIEQEAAMESEATRITVIRDEIIYKLIDDYKVWIDNEKAMEKEGYERYVTFPGMVRILPNSCFRISHPAVFGVEVVAGRIKPSFLLMKENGDIIGRVREMQNNGMSKAQSVKGEEVAISIDDITFGRQVHDNEVLYTFMNDESISILKYKKPELLSEEERILLDRIYDIQRAK